MWRGRPAGRAATRATAMPTAPVVAGRRAIRLSVIRSSSRFRVAARHLPRISRRRRLRPAPPASAVAGGAGAGMPPRGERRFVPDEVITAFAAGATPQAIEQLARRHNLTQLETINLP